MTALLHTTFTNPKTGQGLAKSSDGQTLNFIGNPQFRTGQFWSNENTAGLEIAEDVTNLIPADVDPLCKSADGLIASGSNTLGVSALKGLFEGSALLATYQDDTTLMSDIMTLPTVSATYAVSFYIWVPQNWDGGNIQASAIAGDFDSGVNTIITEWLSASSPRETWFRVTCTLAVGTPDITGTVLRCLTSSGPTAGRFIYIDGLQIEENDYPTPFHASNVNARIDQHVKIPIAGNFPGFSQGTIIINFRPDWAFNTGQTNDPHLWGMFFDSNNEWYISYIDGTGVFQFFMRISGSNTAILSAAQTFIRGDKLQLIATWDGVDGDLFTNSVQSLTGSKTQRNSILPANMYLGAYAGGLANNNCNGVFDEVSMLDIHCNQRLATKINDNFLLGNPLAALVL